ncbi:Protein ENHANCED DISEASE RESISTANCE 4 [Senna tora]|uniref:Protein ENHANCED DISEASE RESISTANCE 4 n=1 Tax=Senna tora TaxID=362788 RepID=A0A834TYF8_9FABA|nr:Protein ENHANCED DISEASE RESISTANCE 4 [Senna tora]
MGIKKLLNRKHIKICLYCKVKLFEGRTWVKEDMIKKTERTTEQRASIFGSTTFFAGECAKKRNNEAVNPASCARETDVAPRNTMDHVSEDKECSNGEQPILPQEQVLRTNTTSSSSGECSLDGDGGSEQIENGKCNVEQPVLPQKKVTRTKTTTSSSRECSFDGDGGSKTNENRECNGEQPVFPQGKVLETKTTSSSSGECSLDGHGGSSQNENGERNQEQPILSQEKVFRTETTCSSSEECSLDGEEGSGRNDNKKCNEKKPVLPQENVVRTKNTFSGEISLDVNGGRDQNENGECDERLLVLPQENVLRTKSSSSSSGECSLDGDGGTGQTETLECSGEQPILPQDKVMRTKTTSPSSGECFLDGDGGSNRNENGECYGEQPVLCQSESGKCIGEHLDLPHDNIQWIKTSSSSGECFLDEIGGRNQNEIVEFNMAFNFEEDPENETDANSLSDIRFKRHKVSNKGCSTELTQTKIKASSVLMGESSVEETNDTHLQLAGEEESDNGNLLLKDTKERLSGKSAGVDANNDKSALIEGKSEGDVTAKSLTSDNSASERMNSSLATPCKPEEGGISCNPVSSNKQMKEAKESIHHSLDHVRLVGTLDTSDVINQSSELSGDLGELPKSSTTRSLHAYDGSVSSYDGVDKRFPDKHLNPFDDTYNVASVVSEGRHRKGKGPISSRNVPSDLPRGMHYAMKDSKRSQYKVLETTRHDRPVRHWMRAEREEFPPRMPFHRNGSQSGYESDIPSNHMHDDELFFSSSSVLSRDSGEDTDHEKTKLLRMIYKLQNQLNRTSSLRERTNGSLSPGVSYKGKHISTSHSRDFHEGRRFNNDLSDPWGDGRCIHGPINWRQRSKFSRIPFSAEATSSTYHVDDSCFHCRHQERCYSAGLPSPVFSQHEELCRYHPGHNCCFSHNSHPWSTARFRGSKPPLHGRKTKSEDQRHRAQEMRMYFREKQSSYKRHFRPVAGGAPFVTCQNCSKLLQLPADFLLFKRVCHQLKCGSCSKILKFSLQNRSHIVSHAPSELDDQSEVINGSINMASLASHANYYRSSHAVPISFSDDYGHSMSKSYSSEGDPISLIPFHGLHDSEYDTNISRGRGTFEEEKKISRHSRTRKDSWGTYASSEREAPPPAPRNSPLHQLMGYSSPSQVIRGVGSSGEGNEFMHYEEPDLS